VNEVWTYLYTTTGTEFLLAQVIFETATSATIALKEITSLSGLGNVLNAARFSSTLATSFYVADIYALRNYQNIPMPLAF